MAAPICGRTSGRRAAAASVAIAAVVGCLASCGSRDPVRKVLLIGIDGVRVDVLADADTPNVDALAADGIYSDEARTRPVTVSGPGWSSMLTGVWMDKHGVRSNDFNGHRYAEYPDFLTRIERLRPELDTVSITDWPPLATTDSGGPLVSPAVDLRITYDGEADGYPGADRRSVDDAVRILSEDHPDAMFVYLGDVDVVAHATSSLSPEYRAAIETADSQVGEIVAAMRARPTYADEDWLVLLSTDHGRRDDGGHGEESRQELTIFYLASGPAVDRQTALEPPPEIVDVGVTALAHLGFDIDPAWNLDGKVVGLR